MAKWCTCQDLLDNTITNQCTGIKSTNMYKYLITKNSNRIEKSIKLLHFNCLIALKLRIAHSVQN